jgi:putative spermidine/putrescine transport system permease protein
VDPALQQDRRRRAIGARSGRAPQLWLLLPAALFLVGLFVLPVMHIVRVSLHPPAGDPSPLGQYVRFARDNYYLSILWFTVKVSLMVTALDLVLGYPVALMIASASRRVARLLYLVVVSPLLVSLVVRTYGWMVILAPNGLVNQALRWLGATDGVHLMYNETGVVIGMTHILLPFVVLTVTAAIQSIDPALGEAAATLGASRLEVFRRVTLPLSLPGVFVGALLVFILTLGSYVTPALLGGDRGVVISSLVFDNSILLANWPFGAAIAVVFLGMSLVIVVLYEGLVGRALREELPQSGS